MNRVLRIARAVACFFWGILKSAAQEIFSPDTWRGFWNVFAGIAEDAKPAYAALWRKMKGEDSPRPLPFKKGLLTRPGANAYVQCVVRRWAVFFFLLFCAIYAVLLFFAVRAVLPAEISGMQIVYGILRDTFWVWAPILLVVPILKYQSDTYALGYYGERAVAEELNKLAHPQWRVFHDFQPEAERGNIDHIVVGAKGIFCLETKTWRHSSEQRRQIAMVDGAIKIKGRRNNFAVVNQAKRNAAALFQFLKKELRTEDGGEVFIPFVAPVIVFPGWYVAEQKGAADVYLCNDKRIGNMLDGMPEDGENALSDDLRKRICAALEKHNRIDIEGML